MQFCNSLMIARCIAGHWRVRLHRLGWCALRPFPSALADLLAPPRGQGGHRHNPPFVNMLTFVNAVTLHFLDNHARLNLMCNVLPGSNLSTRLSARPGAEETLKLQVKLLIRVYPREATLLL